MNKKQLYLFNRLILAQAYIFSKQCEADKADMPAICYRIKTAGFNSMHINRFDDEERACIKALSELPKTEELRKIQSSAVINILELMRLWVEDIPKEDRLNINISDSSLKIGKNHYIKHMLKLRKTDTENHATMRELMDVSSETTKKWYNMAHNHIKNTF